jgi:hypothetical protein
MIMNEVNLSLAKGGMPTFPERIVVHWRRFSSGLWRVPEGDIQAAYCATNGFWPMSGDILSNELPFLGLILASQDMANTANPTRYCFKRFHHVCGEHAGDLQIFDIPERAAAYWQAIRSCESKKPVWQCEVDLVCTLFAASVRDQKPATRT